MTLLAFSADENDSAICSESESTVLPEEWFRLETPARLRDTWLARLCIVPVRWNAETGEVHYLQHASLQVQPAELLTPQVPFAFSPENPDRHRALAMEASFLKQTLGSSQMISLKESPQGSEHGLISTQWEATPYPPNYLVVANQDAQNQLALQEWLAWKRQKGHHVTLVSENETAFTYSAIRERILDEYLNSPYPPYYVLLVGDVTGPYAIPAQYPTYDHGYVCLLGNDVMADFAIGRVSVETATSLATVFNKIVAYERNPFVESTDWMQRASFITGSNHCGISMSQLCRSVAFQLVGEKGYTQVDTVFCGPSPAYVYDWYNQGISFHTYRGWFGRRGLIQP